MREYECEHHEALSVWRGRASMGCRYQRPHLGQGKPENGRQGGQEKRFPVQLFQRLIKTMVCGLWDRPPYNIYLEPFKSRGA